MTAVWLLAWVGSVVLGGVLVGELWIRLRDNYRRDGIDLDEMDRPTPSTEEINAEVDRTNVAIRAYNRNRPLGQGYDIPEVSRWVDFDGDTLHIRKNP